MKKIIFSLLTVVVLIFMALPTGIPVVMGQGVGNETATNQTATNETIQSPLVADFGFDIPDCPLCEGITFTDRSSGGVAPYTYDWDFGDGSNSTEQNPTHQYADYGNYTATLTVTDSASDVASENKTVTLAPQEITVEALGSDSSTTGATGSWPRCISGCTANDASITYIWLVANPNCTPGTPTSAQLWATFEINRSHGVCCLVSVVDIYVDGYFVDDYITRIGDFIAAGTYDVKIADVTWPCGSEMTLKDIYAQWIPKGGQPCPTCDGNCDDYDIPSKCYYDPGPYEVHAPLIADFKADPVCYCNNTIFIDKTTGGVTPYEYSWDFDDSDGIGTDSTDEDPIYHYDSAGTYAVTLTVTDDEGTIDSEIHNVTVHPNPTADAGTDKEIYKGSSVEIGGSPTASGGTSPYTFSWTPTEGLDNPAAANPNASPTSTTTYTVTVADVNECIDSDDVVVTVTKRPLEITADSDSKVYDGTPLTNSGYSITSGTLVGGHTLESVVVTGSQTEVGSSDNVPSGAVIKDNGTDVTGNYDITYVNGTLTVAARPTPPPARRGGGGCPETKYLTVDWEGNNTTEPLYSNDKLAVSLLGPSLDLSHSLFLELGTHAPVVGGRTHYLIVVRELEEIPDLPENLTAIVVFNITPVGAVFDKNVFLTLGIEELPEDALNVTMAYYDDVNGLWETLEHEAGGPPNSVAELSLSAPINHFSIYGVLAELEPTSPPQPAHFVGSGLNIEPSVEKTVFVTRTGETVTITANIENNGGQEDTHTVELKIDGETVDTETVLLSAGLSHEVSFTVSGLDYGQHEVEVDELSDEFTTSRNITWWLILIIILAIGLIVWGAVRVRRSRRATKEG